MATQSTEKHLFDLEKKYWQAMKERDVETALALTDFPCIIAGTGGVQSIDEPTFKRMLGSPDYEIKKVALEDPKIRMIRDDVAVLAYKVHEELKMNGKSMHIEASDASTWIRRNGKWVCALHTEAIKSDPFNGQTNGEARNLSVE